MKEERIIPVHWVASKDVTRVDKMDASWVAHSAADWAASMANQWVVRSAGNSVAWMDACSATIRESSKYDEKN